MRIPYRVYFLVSCLTLFSHNPLFSSVLERVNSLKMHSPLKTLIVEDLSDTVSKKVKNIKILIVTPLSPQSPKKLLNKKTFPNVRVKTLIKNIGFSAPLLKTLCLIGHPELHSLRGITPERFPSLTKIHLSYSGIKTLNKGPPLPLIKTLIVFETPLKSSKGIGVKFPNVRNINACNCLEIKRIKFSAGLLERLDLDGSNNLTSLKKDMTRKKFPNLTWLRLPDGTKLSGEALEDYMKPQQNFLTSFFSKLKKGCDCKNSSNATSVEPF